MTQVRNSYSQSQIEVESPQKLIELLYEGVLRFCARAKLAIKNEDIESRVHFIKRSVAIFIELINSLDFSQEGDMGLYLSGLYLREIQLLSQANFDNDLAKIDEVIRVTKELLRTWRELNAPGQDPGQDTGPNPGPNSSQASQ